MSEETKPEPLAIDTAIREHRERIDRLQGELAWMIAQRDKIKHLPAPTFCGGKVDYDHLEHADVVKVIRTVGGKWKKQPASGDKVNYNSEGELGGRKVRCYNGSPPPSCKIIEVEEHVPAQPATVRKVKKLVCLPEFGAVIAIAAEKHQQEQGV